MGSLGKGGGAGGGALTSMPTPTAEPEEELLITETDVSTESGVDESLFDFADTVIDPDTGEGTITKEQLQAEMGQTGDEAGRADAYRWDKLYVNTSRSYNINAYLNSDGETIHSENSEWDKYGYTKEKVEADIKKIDAGMKELTRDVQVTRFIDLRAMSPMLGIATDSPSAFRSLLSKLSGSDEAFKADFLQAIRDRDYTHKGYTSTSTVNSHPSYGDRDIKLNIVMRKGTKAIMTNNDAEHELLGAHGLKYNFVNYRIENVRTPSGRMKKQLVFDVVI